MLTRFVPALALISWLTATAAMAQASSSPPAARPLAALVPLVTTDAKTQALDFVRSYAAVSTSGTLARWGGGPICARVSGLPSDQQVSVKTRIEEVAAAAGLKTWSGSCKVATDIQIVFTADPQGVLDIYAKDGSWLPGAASSGVKDAMTVTLPIQAWYKTDEGTVAENIANDAKGLKVRVVYPLPPAVSPTAWNPSDSTCLGCDWGNPPDHQQYANPWASSREIMPPSRSSPPRPNGHARALVHALVIVDTQRVASNSLSLISDYVAMLALSQSRAPGECNALPSVTDLFASCPGRPGPTGLTPADSAYLTALYAKGGPRLADESGIAGRMADLLVKGGWRSSATGIDNGRQ